MECMIIVYEQIVLSNFWVNGSIFGTLCILRISNSNFRSLFFLNWISHYANVPLLTSIKMYVIKLRTCFTYRMYFFPWRCLEKSLEQVFFCSLLFSCIDRQHWPSVSLSFAQMHAQNFREPQFYIFFSCPRHSTRAKCTLSSADSATLFYSRSLAASFAGDITRATIKNSRGRFQCGVTTTLTSRARKVKLTCLPEDTPKKKTTREIVILH